MRRIDNVEVIVEALDSMRLTHVFLNDGGAAPYSAYVGSNGEIAVPFADGRVEIYERWEWREWRKA